MIWIAFAAVVVAPVMYFTWHAREPIRQVHEQHPEFTYKNLSAMVDEGVEHADEGVEHADEGVDEAA